MVFTYFKQTGINLRYGDDNEVYDSEDEGYDFEYEVEDCLAADELPMIMADDDKFWDDNSLSHEDREIAARSFVTFLQEVGDIEQLLSYYYEELKDVFYDEAIESEENY